MKGLTRRRPMGWLMLALVGVLFLAPALEAWSQSNRRTAPKAKVRELQRNLSGVQQQKRRLQQQIRQKAREARVVMGDIEQVDGRLTQLESSLEVTTSRLSQGKRRQQTLSQELKAAQDALDQKRLQAARRLRVIYMSGDESGMAALLSARNLSELAARKTLMERLAERDRELFAQLIELRKGIAHRKQRQDALVREVQGLRVQQVNEQGELAEKKTEKRELLVELRSQQAALRRQYDELDAESDRLAASIRAYQARMRSSGQAVSPFRGTLMRPVNGRITSGFGSRFHPILRERRMHAGVDFAAPSGTPIRAAAPGVVIQARYSRGYGNMIVIDHGGGLSTLYAHCSRLFVRSGARVDRGDVIASVGSTGLSTGPHLHFEVRINGSPVNPMSRL